MNKIYNLFFFLLVALVVSCGPDDDHHAEPLRNYAEQYAKDLDTINEFIDTHYMTVSPDFDVTFTALAPTDTEHQSIRNQTEYPLEFKMVNQNEIDYKVYYIKFREGENKRPASVDSVHVSYKGNLINMVQFDAAPSPVWLPLDNTISGWREIIPLFKTGFYDVNEGPNPITFTGYGAGVMFLPSALGYYAQTVTRVPSYSPLIFDFKLYELRYRDHDHDGILSKDEVATAGGDPLDYDSDGDGIPNYGDVDDDGDHIMTKNEIHFDDQHNLIFEDCDGDGTANYLDNDGDNDGVKDYEDPTGICH